ncbi:hypothetical protein COCHEDRAFT_1218347 [Bipolaris maydis C5]|uniref:Uncharacterized protein n=1 Tax=Cochliobolus heterostrophus (strain C5 / ATCC 48332 / race O) TaxID=701091 RepID=M2UFV0_COCH5|nr:hypothetical protein COCHEDRAFT_1218347 [Bipolaris maydis C5]KAJ6265104.1 hypothetical protein PSV08DRAFT_357595 [Bipolaris maydis]
MEDEEEEEEQRSYGENDMVALDAELEHDENTEWLRGCEWPTWFAHKPIHIIVAAAALPSVRTSEDLVLGLWNGFECVSSAQTERVIWKILEASRIVFQRCEMTLKQTPRVLRCWLRSWTPSFLPYPFELPQREQTRRRYYVIHERFLCYIFRILALSRSIKEPTSEISGLQLTTAQLAMMNHIWSRFSNVSQQADCGVLLQPSLDGVHENLFQLLVMFWTDLSHDGNMSRSAIMHFSGVLGIHPTELFFRKPYNYTPFISALLWVGRLIILEYALPLAPYNHLKAPWPERTVYPDQSQRLREHIRPKYLQRGSLAPAGYLIERLQHGRAIARREGPQTNISWSLDGLTLYIADTQVHMRQFRETIHSVVVRLQNLTQDLLFNWWPDVQLNAVQDDLAAHRPGFSFLTHPANKLQGSFRIVSRLAFSEQGGFSLETRRGKAKMERYLKKSDQFIRLLYAAMHMTNGMPARGEEFRVLRWADTVSVQRNIFVYKGKVVLVFSYNKANTNTNNSFYIVRSPCPIVQRILYLYLVYIRPFRGLISRNLGILPKNSTNPHLFSTHESATSCFSSDQAYASLKKATAGCSVPMNTSLYRQTAVSIAKKHLPGLVAPFDPSTPKDYNGFLQLLAFQTGHRPVTHASAYALEHGFPTKLQPDLIDRYLVNSHMWHEFTLTREEDVLDDSLADARYASSSTSQVDYCPDNVNARRLECGTPEESDVNLSDEPSPRQRQEERQQRRKKRGRENILEVLIQLSNIDQ